MGRDSHALAVWAVTTALVRAAAEKRALCLGIAGFRLSLENPPASLASIALRRYGAFLSSPEKPAISAAVTSMRGSGRSFKPSVRKVGGSLLLNRGDFGFSLDSRSGRGHLSAAPRSQTIDAFLRALLSSLLNERGGALLHACGLAIGGKAHVFIGRSGAGKSTLARLAAAAGVEVISDEIVPLRRERGRFYVYGSPFWGEMRSGGRPLRLPLAGIYSLRKARSNSLRPGPSADFMPLFLRCCLNFSKDPSAARGLLETAASASASYRGEFFFSKKEDSFLGLLK